MDAIKADRKNILEVLKRNGLMVGENIPDLTLFYVVRDAMGKSQPFKKDLYSVLTVYIMNSSNQNNNIMENNMYLNAGGDPILNSTTVATTGTAKAPSEWSAGNIFNKVITLGDKFLDYNKTEAEKLKAEAEKAKAIAAGKISDSQGSITAATPAEKSNTTLYVVLGVVLLASVGGFVYLKNRNKV
jgi:LPXTG-motif cell wall-anchored protein